MTAILIILGRYLPGYKDGGPVQSIRNLTDWLGDEYDFRILTTDRDQGDIVAYPNICYNTWNQVGKAKVWYVKPGGFSGQIINKLAKDVKLVYVCGCYSDYARVVLRLRRSGQLQQPTVVAPMGLFSPGALKIGYVKKKLYLTACKLLGWFRNVAWSVTGEREEREVHQIIGKNAICFQARDIPRHMEKMPKPIEKNSGKLNIVFLSRISPEKNLKYAIEVLEQLKGDVCFDIYGTMENEDYFVDCMKAVESLPSNVSCDYKGQVRPDEVLEVFSRYHVFLFPTKGENYGHVIYEAMAGGCIPVISDRTPWQELEDRRIGRVIPMENMEEFSETLQQLVDMTQSEYDEWQKRVADYAWEYGMHIDCQGYRNIFALNASLDSKLGKP